ncbi:MAG: hypothetical protein ABIB93_00065 [Chloroflexota bacterium]
MLVGFVVMLTMLFIGWLIFRALSGKLPSAHVIMYLLSVLTGIYTFTFFLSMEINLIIKVIFSIMTGIILIFGAILLQRRLTSGQQ